MSEHLSFMKSVVVKPIHVIRRELDRSHRSGPLDNRIVALDEEKTIFHGNQHIVHRLYVKAHDSGFYEATGWVLNVDADCCLICGVSFGMFVYKHHCKACGLVTCDSCASERSSIAELPDCGPLRVCRQCFFGQDPVYALDTRTRSDRSISQGGSDASNLRDLTMSSDDETIRNSRQSSSSDKDAIASHIKNRNSSSSNTSNNGATRNDSSETVNSNSLSKMPGAVEETKASSSKSESSIRSRTQSVKVTRIPPNVEFMLIRPLPGIVLKTRKRSESDEKETKVFVNITTHEGVPFKHENPPPGSPPDTVQLDKVLNMVLGPAQNTVDKDGALSIVYDVVVHPNELQITFLDVTAQARNRLCQQSLQLIQLMHNEVLDSSYKILRLNGNYKFSSSLATNEIPMIAIPQSPEGFYHLKQMHTIPSDVNIRAAQTQEKARKASHIIAVRQDDDSNKRTQAVSMEATIDTTMDTNSIAGFGKDSSMASSPNDNGTMETTILATSPNNTSNLEKTMNKLRVRNLSMNNNANPTTNNFNETNNTALTNNNSNAIAMDSNRRSLLGKLFGNVSEEPGADVVQGERVTLTDFQPVCAIKTRMGSTKIFLNLYQHPLVPLYYTSDKCEVPGLLSGSPGCGLPWMAATLVTILGGPQSTGQIAILAQSLVPFKDKENQNCMLGQVAISSQALASITEMSCDDQNTLCLIHHIISVFNYYSHENLEVEGFSLPKVKHGYKGVRMTEMTYTISESGLIGSAKKNTRDENGNVIKGISVYILPLSEYPKYARVNVTSPTWIEGKGEYRVAVDDLVLRPDTACVLDVKLKTGMPAVLVIRHAAGVGKLAGKLSEKVNEGPPQIKDLVKSIVIGGVNINCVVGDKKFVLFDVLIPSSIVSMCNFVTLNVITDQVILLVIMYITNELKVQLDSRYSISEIKAYSLPLHQIVANLTETNLRDNFILFQGEFFKLGTQMKNWKLRMIELACNKLRYFEPSNSIQKGQLEFSGPIRCNILKPTDCGAPENSFPLMIKAYAADVDPDVLDQTLANPDSNNKNEIKPTDDLTIYCYQSVDTIDWKNVLTLYNAINVNSKLFIRYPAPRVGWLGKQGHFIKNWQKRFCVLENGTLTYYEKDNQNQGYSKEVAGNFSTIKKRPADASIAQNGLSDQHGNNKKGFLNLKGATCEQSQDGKEYRIVILNATTETNQKKELILEAESVAELNMWMQDIRKHIAFINDFVFA